MSNRDRSRSRSYSPPPRRGRENGFTTRREPTAGTSLLIRNLAREAQVEDVRNLVSSWEVKDLHLPVDYYTKERRDFGFVEFFNRRDADDALEALNGVRICGKEIQVTLAQRGRKKRDEYGRGGGGGGGEYGGYGRDNYGGGRDGYDDGYRGFRNQGGYGSRESREYRRNPREFDRDNDRDSRDGYGRDGYGSRDPRGGYGMEPRDFGGYDYRGRDSREYGRPRLAERSFSSRDAPREYGMRDAPREYDMDGRGYGAPRDARPRYGGRDSRGEYGDRDGGRGEYGVWEGHDNPAEPSRRSSRGVNDHGHGSDRGPRRSPSYAEGDERAVGRAPPSYVDEREARLPRRSSPPREGGRDALNDRRGNDRRSGAADVERGEWGRRDNEEVNPVVADEAHQHHRDHHREDHREDRGHSGEEAAKSADVDVAPLNGYDCDVMEGEGPSYPESDPDPEADPVQEMLNRA